MSKIETTPQFVSPSALRQSLDANTVYASIVGALDRKFGTLIFEANPGLIGVAELAGYQSPTTIEAKATIAAQKPEMAMRIDQAKKQATKVTGGKAAVDAFFRNSFMAVEDPTKLAEANAAWAVTEKQQPFITRDGFQSFYQMAAEQPPLAVNVGGLMVKETASEWLRRIQACEIGVAEVNATSTITKVADAQELTEANLSSTYRTLSKEGANLEQLSEEALRVAFRQAAEISRTGVADDGNDQAHSVADEDDKGNEVQSRQN